MGADFLFRAVPQFELTEARRQELDRLFSLPEESEQRQQIEKELIDANYVTDDDPDERSAFWKDWMERARALFDKWPFDGRRDAGLWQPAGCPFEYLVTGGMSWGDPPTDLYELLEQFAVPVLYRLARKWAEEDAQAAIQPGEQDAATAPAGPLIILCRRRDIGSMTIIGAVTHPDPKFPEKLEALFAQWRAATPYPDTDSEFAEWLVEHHGCALGPDITEVLLF